MNPEGFDLEAFAPEARALALCFVRTLAALAPLPAFGQGLPARFTKVGLGAGMAVLCRVSGAAAFSDPGASPFALGVAGLCEVFFGLLLGFTARLALEALRVAGDFVSHEMGLNLSHQLDPASGQAVPLLGYLYEAVGTCLFFAYGAHHALVAAVFRSFGAVPLGRPPEFGRMLPALLGFGGGLLETGLRLAAPVFFALVLVTIVLAFLAKVAPQWHLLDAGYPLRAGVGLALIALSTPVLRPTVAAVFDATRAGLEALTAPA